MHTVKLDSERRRRLTALTHCAARDISRPVLAGVHFQGQRALASDSYVLGLVDLEGDDLPGRLVPARDLGAALRAASKAAEVRLEFAKDHVTVVVDDKGLLGQRLTTTRLDYIDGEFPDLSSIIKSAEKVTTAEGEPPIFNFANVDRVAALAPATSVKSPVRLVQFRWADAQSPVRVDHKDQMLGLVMPRRDW